MKCFNHPEREAIALCVRCWRPLCRDCGVMIAGKMTCKRRCEEDRFNIEQADTLRKEQSTAAKRTAGPMMGGLLGLPLLIGGYFGFREAQSLNSTEMLVIACISVGLGLIVLIGAVASYFSREE